MQDDKIFGDAEISLAREIASVVGMDTHTKEASAEAPEGTPAEDVETLRKEAGLVKVASDMNLEDILENEHFRRGVFDEIEASRSVWEPIARARMGLEG